MRGAHCLLGLKMHTWRTVRDIWVLSIARFKLALKPSYTLHSGNGPCVFACDLNLYLLKELNGINYRQRLISANIPLNTVQAVHSKPAAKVMASEDGHLASRLRSPGPTQPKLGLTDHSASMASTSLHLFVLSCREPAHVRKYFQASPRCSSFQKSHLHQPRHSFRHAMPFSARTLLGLIPRPATLMTIAQAPQNRYLELWIHPCAKRLGPALAPRLQPKVEEKRASRPTSHPHSNRF